MNAIARRAASLVGAGWLTLAMVTSLHAESTLRFRVPQDFGTKPAVTHDVHGRAIGTASMSVERTGDDKIHLVGTAAVDTGGSTRVEADFEILDGGSRMKLVRQLSESITAEGRSLGTLRVEHDKGKASCTPPSDSDREVVVLTLPPTDRVANVPLHLLFAPLARGEQKETRFDVLLCREDPRFMEFEAWVVEPATETAKSGPVEIRYRPALGKVLGFLAQSIVPDLRFWVDGAEKDRYVGHRMPLYARGPEIWVLREGVTPSDLRAGMPPSNRPTIQDNRENQDEDRSHAPGR